MANFRQNSMRQSIQMQHHLQTAKNKSTIVKSLPEHQLIEEPIAEIPVESIIETPTPEPIIEVQSEPVVEEPKQQTTISRLPNNFKK